MKRLTRAITKMQNEPQDNPAAQQNFDDIKDEDILKMA